MKSHVMFCSERLMLLLETMIIASASQSLLDALTVTYRTGIDPR